MKVPKVAKEFPIHTVNKEMKRAQEPKINSDVERENPKIIRFIMNSEIARTEAPEVPDSYCEHGNHKGGCTRSIRTRFSDYYELA